MLQVPRTITVPETVQKDVEIQVSQLQYVEREIRIPEQVMETKTVRVPRQRIVIEEEEVMVYDLFQRQPNKNNTSNPKSSLFV